MADMLNIAMLGATGRMGRSIIPLIAAHADGLRLSGALAAAGDPGLGQDAGVFAGTAPLAVAITDQAERALADAQVAIDFTLAEASVRHANACRARNCALVIGTTGQTAAQRAELEEVARGLPIVLAPNMSLGVNVLFRLAELAGRALKAADYDAEIFEAHHRNKVDAPSGTAIRTAEMVAEARAAAGLAQMPDATRDEMAGARGAEVAGVRVHSIRAAGLVAHQEVLLGTSGETLTIRHDSVDRKSFMPGVLLAVRSVRQRPGLTVGLGPLLGLGD